MARIFISHSSTNNAEALALRDWLVARGWDDLFLDIDPQRGLVSGQRWLERLQESAQRCKAVLFVLSRGWLRSRYCTAEFWEARKQERPLFAVVIDDTAVSEVPAEMRGVWQLAFLTQGSRFETFSVLPPPHYAPVEVRFSHEGLDSLRLGLAQAGLTSFDTESFPWPSRGYEHEADGTTPRRPYRGLKPVDIPDAGVFFGRDADLVRARDHLADLCECGARCLVVILGASSAGKSSFLRAGLLPRLARDDRRFLVLPVVRPREAAMWGDEGLLVALETAYRNVGLAATRAALRKDLEEGGAVFLRRLADLRSAAASDLEKDAKPPTLILPVDQAEELLTTVRGATSTDEAGLFLARLAEIVRHGPETLAMITIRSDAYEPLQMAAALEGVVQVPFNLPPLATTNYCHVIEGPADRVSAAGRPLKVEPRLAAALLADAQGADALPLLGFTLERLYVEHGGDRNLTLADYHALGGVQGSIEAAVAEAFADPDGKPRIPTGAAEREVLLKRVFVPHLMGVIEANGEPVRRTARLADLPEAARGLIDRLIERRLLVIDRRNLEGGTEETVIEVAHEALLRRWPTLRRWHDQERAALEIQQEIARASAAWSQNARGADWLTHRGVRLADAEGVSRREDFAKAFEGVPSDYLAACRQAEDVTRDAEARRLARQRSMQRRVGVLLAAVALVTLVGGWLVMSGRRELERQRSRLLVANSEAEVENGQYDRGMRLALMASQGKWFAPPSVDAEIQLGRAAHFSRLEAQLTPEVQPVFYEKLFSASFSPNDKYILTNGFGTLVWSIEKDGAWQSVTPKDNQRSATSWASFLSNDLLISGISSDSHYPLVWSQGKKGAWRSFALEGKAGWHSYSADPVRIVTTSGQTALLWSQGEGGTWQSVALNGHQGHVDSAILSRDGTRIVTISQQMALVWSQGKDGAWRSAALDGHQGHVDSATLSRDGTRIVTFSKEIAVVWSLGKDGAWHGIALQGYQGEAVISPDGTSIVTTSEDTALVWSQEQGGSWHSKALKGHRGFIASAAFSPDSALIVTACWDGSVRVWSLSNLGEWHAAVLNGHTDRVNSAAFSSDGTYIVTASDDGSARVWNHGKGTAWESVAQSQSKDGRWYSMAVDRHQGSIDSMAASPDGAHIVTTSKRTVLVWSQSQDGTWHSVALPEHQDSVSLAAISPDGAYIITASEDPIARVWSRGQDGTWHSVPLEGHYSRIRSATFSLDGSHIVTAAQYGAIVWSRGQTGAWSGVALGAGEEERVRRAEEEMDTNLTEGYLGFMRIHPEAFTSASFSPDGARIITAVDGTVTLWSQGEDGAWEGIRLESVESGLGQVASGFFSPDGTRIVTELEDAVHVWSQGENGAWTNITLEDQSIESAEFSSDGKQILTTSISDGTTHVWDIRWLRGPGDWARTEPLSLPETVCREKLHGSWVTVKDPKTGLNAKRIAERLLTADDIKAAPILAGREGEDVCAPFLEKRPWWSRLVLWR